MTLIVPEWTIFLFLDLAWAHCVTLGVIDIGIVDRNTGRGVILLTVGAALLAATLNMMIGRA